MSDTEPVKRKGIDINCLDADQSDDLPQDELIVGANTDVEVENQSLKFKYRLEPNKPISGVMFDRVIKGALLEAAAETGKEDGNNKGIKTDSGK